MTGLESEATPKPNTEPDWTETEIDRVHRAMPRWTPGHAVACLIHYGGQCSRMPGCLQDGR